MLLDHFTREPIGDIGTFDLSWRSGGLRGELLHVGGRVSAEVTAVDLRARRVRLSRTATENPRLWAFLKGLRQGQRLSGTVAAIERFGVFVDLDDGPPHPALPGVGFISIPNLSWRQFEHPSEMVSIGQHITCEFIGFDTIHGEAGLSLRALQPDPFQQCGFHVGQILRGRVTKLAPIGAFVRIADGVEGLVPLGELAASPVETPEDVVQVGDEVTVVITEFDQERRRVALSCRQAH